MLMQPGSNYFERMNQVIFGGVGGDLKMTGDLFQCQPFSPAKKVYFFLTRG